MMKSKHTYILNALANITGYVFNAAGLVVVVGVLSRVIGQNGLGLYFLLMILPSFVAAMDFGLGVQITRAVARWNIGEAEIGEVDAIITVWLCLAAVILAVGVAAACLYKLCAPSISPPGSAYVKPVYLFVIIFLSVTSFCVGSFMAILKGVEKFRLLAVVNSCASACLAVVSTTLFIGDWRDPLLLMLVYHLIVSSTQFLVLFFFVRNVIKIKIVRVSHVKPYFIDIVQYGRSVIGARLVMAAIANGVKLLSASMFGLATAGFVGAGVEAGRRYHAVFFGASEVLLPRFSRSGTWKREGGRELLLLSLGAFGLSALGFAVFLIVGHSIVSLWLGEQSTRLAYIVISILLASYVVQAPLPLLYQYVMGAGIPRLHFEVVGLIGVTLCLLMAAVYFSKSGIIVFLLAYLLSFSLGTIYYGFRIARKIVSSSEIKLEVSSVCSS